MVSKPNDWHLAIWEWAKYRPGLEMEWSAVAVIYFDRKWSVKKLGMQKFDLGPFLGAHDFCWTWKAWKILHFLGINCLSWWFVSRNLPLYNENTQIHSNPNNIPVKSHTIIISLKESHQSHKIRSHYSMYIVQLSHSNLLEYSPIKFTLTSHLYKPHKISYI